MTDTHFTPYPADLELSHPLLASTPGPIPNNPARPQQASRPLAPRSLRTPRTAFAAVLMGLGLAACGQGERTGTLSQLDAQAAESATQGREASLRNETAPSTGLTDQTAAEDMAVWADSAGIDPSRTVLYSSPALKAVASHDICRNILARNNRLVGGMVKNDMPLPARPPMGVAVQEPTYGSCLVRLTNQSATRGRFHRNDYSRRQAFNVNGTRMFLYAEDGHWHLYDAQTGKWIKKLNGLAGDAEPHWHGTDPNLIYFLPTNGVGMKIYQLDVARNKVSVAADMGKHIRARWPDAHTAWTRSEGSPSASGRFWCFMTEHIRHGQWLPRGVFTWDMQKQRIIGSMPISTRPDHVSMSPSGRYCVVSGDDKTGTRAYRWHFKAPYSNTVRTPYLQLHHKSEHSDLALNKDRHDVYVSIDYQSHRGDVFMMNLDTGEKTPLFPTYQNRTATALHISGKAYRKRGWVLVSTYGEHHAATPWQHLRHSAARQWSHRKIFAVSLEKNPKIRALAYTHSDALSYWAEPHASVNLDFTRILFNSTWNSNNGRDMEAFMLAIPHHSVDWRTR
ncbi:MAG: hypothetical protein Q4D91_04590 [Lautropia sp.]|nr:hypothetical protein [Lautropia sp.]